MTHPTTIDLGHVARDLGLTPNDVQRTVELLDEGNTVPFITRYRKDQTGGLDEEQIREIQFRVGKIRQLAERKATILKTIEAQGKLTPELADQIQHANTPKRLEDLYLPFKPKKQTLATVARERGLEPLAIEIFEAHPTAADLPARASQFFSAEKELNTVEEVLAGVGHLIAERLSENAELRGRLRRIFQRSGRIVCAKIEPPPGAKPTTQEEPAATATEGQSEEETKRRSADSQAPEATIEAHVDQSTAESAGEAAAKAEIPAPAPDILSTAPNSPAEEVQVQIPDAEVKNAEPAGAIPLTSSPLLGVTDSAPLDTSNDPPPAATTEHAPGPLAAGRLFHPPAAPVAAPDLKKKKKKKKKVIGEHAFKDYYNYGEPLGRVPPHRVLAINRGERAHAIRVKIDADVEAMFREAEFFLIGPNHPHGDFLRGCIRDSLTRLIMPSLERELRREMTERAEEHAVEVFVRN
jgi:uncharacterized protein